MEVPERIAHTEVSLNELASLCGTHLGATDWITVTQEMINAFANATSDHQWIHTDVQRAKEGPFGATIAHGFMTLSLVPRLWGELLKVTGEFSRVRYELDRVRFTYPVKVDTRVRMKAAILEIWQTEGSKLCVVADALIEIQGIEQPAIVASILTSFE